MPTELPDTNVLPPSRIDRQFAKHLSEGPHLDTLPTSDKPPKPQSFREQSVAQFKPQIDRLNRIFEYGEMDPHYATRKRLNGCRTNATIMQNTDTHELRVTSRHCNHRWCPMCMGTRRWIITDSVKGWLEKRKHPKFLTFTLKSCSDPLDDQVERLYDCFRKIRRRTWLQKLIKGGVWFFQFTYNYQTGQFHPHVHCLVDGQYIPHGKLKKSWLEITGDSFIVDVRKVDDIDKASEYVARYATAPANLTKIPVPVAAAAIIALKGRRIVGSFGSARGMHLAPRKPDEPSKWVRVVDFWMARVMARWDPLVQLIFEYLENPQPSPPPLFDLDRPHPKTECVMELEPLTWKQATFGWSDHYDFSSPLGLLDQHRPKTSGGI